MVVDQRVLLVSGGWETINSVIFVRILTDHALRDDALIVTLVLFR